jgi:hypothetical protein
MAVGDQDHGRVAMPVAAMLAGVVHQPLDLALGEIASLDCQVYDVWGAFLGCRFHADKPCRFFCTVVGTVIAMQDEGTGAGAQHGGAGREANLIFVLPPNVYVAPRRGDFLASNFHPGPFPGNLA